MSGREGRRPDKRGREMSKEARALHEMTDRPQLKHGGVFFFGKIEKDAKMGRKTKTSLVVQAGSSSIPPRHVVKGGRLCRDTSTHFGQQITAGFWEREGKGWPKKNGARIDRDVYVLPVLDVAFSYLHLNGIDQRKVDIPC